MRGKKKRETKTEIQNQERKKKKGERRDSRNSAELYKQPFCPLRLLTPDVEAATVSSPSLELNLTKRRGVKVSNMVSSNEMKRQQLRMK